MLTQIYVVTYKTSPSEFQKELIRYTKESAWHFANGICDAGGVAVVNESWEEAPEGTVDDLVSTPITESKGQLLW